MTIKISPPGDIFDTDSDVANSYPSIVQGSGVPTANLPVGSLYLRTDGSTGTSIYIKEATGTTWGTISAGAGLSQATADTLYTSLAPASAARNLITPGANMPALTIAAPSASTGEGIRFATLQTPDFGIYVAEQTFAGTPDPALFWGYNMNQLGNPKVAGEPALWFGLESNYDTGPTNLMEWNLDYRNSAGAAATRFMGFSVDRATDKANWLFVTNETAVNLGFQIASSTTVINFLFRPAGARQVHFAYAGGANEACYIGGDGTANAPDRMVFGPEALSGTGLTITKTGFAGIGQEAPLSRLWVENDNAVGDPVLVVRGKTGQTAGGNLFTVESQAGADYFNIGGTGAVAITSNGTTTFTPVAAGQTTVRIDGPSGGGSDIRMGANAVADVGVLECFGSTLSFKAGSTYVFDYTSTRIAIADAKNIQVGTTTGTKIGTGATQKLGFWDKAPVVQPTGIADASTAHALNVVFSDTEVETALNALGVKINAVITALESIGILATV